ncbi:Universal stress protein MSMEG_3950 [Chlamydia trachomatis]|nr:Universal stress protein MSMEG_3950 [Chlamydia trachomatis]
MTWAPTGLDHSNLLKDVRTAMGVAIDQALDGRDMEVARHALDGSPASLLIEFSTAVDLVVVGTRGRGGLAGVLLGSTAQTVLSHSTCPVMIVPSDHLGKAESAKAPTWERR